MKNTGLKVIFFLIVAMMITSCASSHKYGKLSDKYSNARSRSYNNTPYKSHSPHYAETKQNNESSNKSKPPIKKISKETESREALVSSAKQYIGLPYKSAGKSPSEGFDCSGFANYIFQTNGYQIAGPSYDLAKLGEWRDAANLKPGDLVFFGVDNRINHVGIVTKLDADDTYFIHSSTSEGIKIDRLITNHYWKSRFLFGRDILHSHFSPYLAAKP